ncbi:MAG: hypothetical protein HKM95_04360 [Inquilinus sp.]|nr:hypothetical protein [Inquilinus sp.]
MQVLALVSTAIGSGKTTLAAHLATQAYRCDVGPVALIDADPSGSLTSWREVRNEPGPVLVEVERADIGAALASLKDESSGLVVLDTASAPDPSIETIIGFADLVAIPVRPGQYDLKAAGATVEMLERFGRRFVFVVNGGSPSADITAESVMALSQHGTVAPAIVPASSEFALRMSKGETVFESDPQGLLSEEIGRLWDFLAQRLSTAPAIAPADRDKAAVKEPRRFPRWDFDQPATLIAGDRRFPCTVNDISAGGALVYGDELPQIGETVAVEISHVGRLNAEVVHHSTSRVGLKFVIGAQQQWTLVRYLSDMIEASRRAYVAAP